MIKIYGNNRSRASRCWWALEELGLDYEKDEINHTEGETQSADYLKLNPAGKVPTMVDGDVVLFESIAINFYLAQKYKGDMWPGNEGTQALALQWSFWGVTEVEPYVVTLCIERVFKPEPARDPAKAEAAEEELKKRLTVLDGHLQKMGGTLTKGPFNIGDLNVAAVLRGVNLFQMDLSPWPHVKSWTEAAYERQAIKKALAS